MKDFYPNYYKKIFICLYLLSQYSKEKLKYSFK